MHIVINVGSEQLQYNAFFLHLFPSSFDGDDDDDAHVQTFFSLSLSLSLSRLCGKERRKCAAGQRVGSIVRKVRRSARAVIVAAAVRAMVRRSHHHVLHLIV